MSLVEIQGCEAWITHFIQSLKISAIALLRCPDQLMNTLTDKPSLM
nr:MAG TPA: hypothetical protein [Caudoviricetes sp.]